IDGKTKEVWSNAYHIGSKSGLQARFVEATAAIDEAVGTDQWVKCDEGRCGIRLRAGLRLPPILEATWRQLGQDGTERNGTEKQTPPASASAKRSRVPIQTRTSPTSSRALAPSRSC